ncbi:cysteine synthase family protein [bacterium]|nr:cysteine synthase family protein [bacterium]
MSNVTTEKGNVTNNRIRDLSCIMGNTPLLAIDFMFGGQKRTIYAKAEHLNFSGSIKDRMAFHIIKQAYAKGTLRPGDEIIEATSGNTGIAFSAIGRALGHHVTIFMPDWMSIERIKLIRSFGAEIVLVSKEQGGFLGSIKMSEDMAAANPRSFLPKQFANEDNVDAHYTTTGPEIAYQLSLRGITPDAFVAGVGTGGTVMGTGKFLREKFPRIKIHPLEPNSSPVMRTNCKQVGEHRIQGIGDDFIPAIVELYFLDEVVGVDDGDGILMAQKLAGELGLGVGISSGANFIGALMLQEKLGKDAVVATVFSDDNKKYLSTDLMKDEPIRKEYLAPRVKLLGIRAFKRVCETCCKPEDCEDVYAASAACNGVPNPQCPRRK